jgi:hypothetical protein
MRLAHAVNYELLLFLGQATAAGETNPAPIQVLGHCPADAFVTAVGRLRVHRFPDRTRLDVLPLQRQPNAFSVRAEPLRINRRWISAFQGLCVKRED